jgi:hypothetical protein
MVQGAKATTPLRHPLVETRKTLIAPDSIPVDQPWGKIISRAVKRQEGVTAAVKNPNARRGA